MTSQTAYPFIYISSLNRTGSTLLSEALSQLPYAYILHEPHLGKNYFAIKEADIARLQDYDIALPEFVRYRLGVAFVMRRLRWLGYRQDYMMRAFKSQLLPQLTSKIQQIGVKEIKHAGWQNYVRHFPDMRVVMTGRDPRDIYISMYHKWKSGTLKWPRPFTPKEVADELNHQFQLQLGLRDKTECLCITYEDLCTDPDILNTVHAFVNSPIPQFGEIGAYVSAHPKRVNEYKIHGDKITSQRVLRWQKETDQNLLSDANTMFNLMPAYNEFWGYSS